MVHAQQAGHAAGQLFGDVVLMGDDLGEVDGDARHLHADLTALVLDLGYQLGAVEQALGGDAAYIQAGAAQILLFHQGHFCPQLRGADRRHIAAGAAADHQYIHCVILLFR